ncbi:MAG: Asp-tRNA(Asn)/Glu-tRNA(Gln) amidotransferase subunit GatA [Nitrososphaerota archaeon]|nr:Asp-tRNA(Asn)/Glu-tRNA(Gln) amidotransferase subunit GatA [Nitrososphaerota archaeon]
MSLAISAIDYINGIKNGSITAEEFIAKTLDHIKKQEPKLHAFLSINEDAIEQARQIDKKIKSGQKVGAFYGMPISIKDNICIKGGKTTCASKMLQNYTSPYDATVVSNLKSQDAILIGKTNLDEFAMGVATEFSAFGPSRNPWNVDYVPGGSSGGSAVSVAGLESILSLGSDTGGSVRNPASFCSIVGLKPTYGLVSRYGLISYSNSIEQIGPMGRKVEDVALLLNHIAGKDPYDPTTLTSPTPDYLSGIDVGISGKKIGIIKEMSSGAGLDKTVESVFRNAMSAFEKLGAKIEEVSLDMVQYTVATYYVLTTAEAGSNLSRYDNLRYGYELDSEGYEFKSYISKARRNFGPEVTRRMILGGFVPSAGFAGKYLLKALKVKNKLKKQIQSAFTKFDYLISPTVPVLPFRFGEKIDDPLAMYLADINTVTANLTGVPAISIPYEIRNGLPVGVQIHANILQEKQLLQAGYALQNTTEIPEINL